METGFSFLAGLVLIIGGAELLVRGSVKIASALGVPPLVIGLTVVAFGTASPELAVSINAAREGHADISVGNIVGSNILNVLLILGISAIVTPLMVARQLIRLDVPLMIAVTAVTFVLSLDGRLDGRDGVFFVTLLLGYIIAVFLLGRKEKKRTGEYTEEYGEKPKNLYGIVGAGILVAGGLAALFAGTPLFVDSAVAFARSWGVSELVISLTIVSVGTSLPEVATSVLASMRGERDIAVGNIVGSNIFNLLAVLGIAAIIAGGLDISAKVIRFDMPVMLAVALVCLPVFWTRGIITRMEGALFVLYYGLYTTYIVLSATQSPTLPGYQRILGFVVLPLTLIALAVGIVGSVRARRAGEGESGR